MNIFSIFFACGEVEKIPEPSNEDGIVLQDSDGDGFLADEDCNNADPNSYTIFEDADCDGAAAADGVRSKRRRYPPHGGELVPLVFEAAGRPAEETVAWVRSWGLELDDADRSKVIRYAWQQYSTVLQSGNAEMILSAIG